jgi:hypothetical protein
MCYLHPFQAAFPLESDIKTMDPAASAEAVAAAATAANIALVRSRFSGYFQGLSNAIWLH